MSGTLPARLRCTTMTSMEATAYREAGHVFMAIYLGARVRSVTIEPDRDDGPDRFGDTQVEWDLRFGKVYWKGTHFSRLEAEGRELVSRGAGLQDRPEIPVT